MSVCVIGQAYSCCVTQMDSIFIAYTQQFIYAPTFYFMYVLTHITQLYTEKHCPHPNVP